MPINPTWEETEDVGAEIPKFEDTMPVGATAPKLADELARGNMRLTLPPSEPDFVVDKATGARMMKAPAIEPQPASPSTTSFSIKQNSGIGDVLARIPLPPPVKPPPILGPLIHNTPPPSTSAKTIEQFSPDKLNNVLNTSLVDYLPKDIQEGLASGLTINHPQLADKADLYIAGSAKGVGDVAKGFLSPVGLATLNMGGVAPAAQRVISLAFATQMASAMPEEARQIGEIMGQPPEQRDYQKLAQLLTAGAGNSFFAAQMGKHGLAAERPSLGARVEAMTPAQKREFAAKQLANALNGRPVEQLPEVSQPGTEAEAGFFAQRLQPASGVKAGAAPTVEAAPKFEETTPVTQAAAPAAATPPPAAENVIRTPDGAVDPVATQMARMTGKLPSTEKTTETGAAPAGEPDGLAVGEQKPPAPAPTAGVQSESNQTPPTIAEKAAANPTATPTMADLAAMVQEIKGNQLKPSETKPAEPAPVEPSPPAVAMSPAAPVASNQHLDVARPDLSATESPITQKDFQKYNSETHAVMHAGTDLSTGEPLYWVVRKGATLKSSNPQPVTPKVNEIPPPPVASNQHLDVARPDLSATESPITQKDFQKYNSETHAVMHAGTDLSTGEPLYWVVRKGATLKSSNPQPVTPKVNEIPPPPVASDLSAGKENAVQPVKPVMTTGESGAQGSRPAGQSDFAHYQQLTQTAAEAVKRGEFPPPEVQSEIEAIKNRNGGMAPAEVSTEPAPAGDVKFRDDAALFDKLVRDFGPQNDWASGDEGVYDPSLDKSDGAGSAVTARIKKSEQMANIRRRAASDFLPPEERGDIESAQGRAKLLPRLVAHLQKIHPGDEYLAKTLALHEFSRKDESAPDPQRAQQDARILDRISGQNPGEPLLQAVRTVRTGADKLGQGMVPAEVRTGTRATAVQGLAGGERVRPAVLGAAGQRTLHELERIFGVRIIRVESKAGGPAPFNGWKDTKSNVLLLDAHAEKPLLVSAGHELGHHIELQNPQLYGQMADGVMNLIREYPKFFEAYRARMDRAGYRGRQLQDVNVHREIVNDFIGDCFKDPKFLQLLAAREPKIFKRFAKQAMFWLDKLIAKAKTLTGYGVDQHISDLEAARGIVVDAVAKFAKEQVTGIREGDRAAAVEPAPADEFSRKARGDEGEDLFMARQERVDQPGAVAKTSDKSTAESDRFTQELKSAWDHFDGEGVGTFADFVDQVEGLARDTDEPAAAAILEAVEKYRDDQRYDQELAGRGDMEQAESEFKSAVEAALRGDFFSAPESVDQQKARVAGEKRHADATKAKAAMQDKAQARLTGADIDTTGDIFDTDRTSRVDKAGQGSLFSKKTGTPTKDNADTRSLEMDNGGVHGPALFSLKAYHGTPHKVDKFTTDKIGTGEGAQAYGWGLYFAENEKVAKDYADKLGSNSYPSREKLREYYKPGKIVPAYGGAFDRVRHFVEDPKGWHVLVNEVRKDAAGNWQDAGPVRAHTTAPDGKKLKAAGISVGNEYAVKLKPSPEELLDWDKPLSEQSDKVKAVIGQLVARLQKETRPEYKMLPSWFEAMQSGQLPGNAIYHALGSGSPEAASKAWTDAGIKGIRFLDQGSRANNFRILSPQESISGKWVVGEPHGNRSDQHFFENEAEARAFLKSKQTSNYVIFHGDDIAITHENGQELTPEQAAKQPLFSRKEHAAGDYLPGDEPAKPERERSAADIKTEFKQAEADLAKSTVRDTKSQTMAEYQQAKALDAARYRTLRDELLHHPEYVAEQLASSHAATVEANDMLKPLGKAVHPEDFPNPSELRDQLTPEQFNRFRELQDTIEKTHMEMARMPKKLVSRVFAEMQDDGRLPKSAPMRSDLGRSLDRLTDWLRTNGVDSPRKSLVDRLNLGRRFTDTVQNAKTSLQKAWITARAVGRAALESYKAPPKDDDFRHVIKSWIYADQRTGLATHQFVKELVARVPHADRRKAMSLWLDADGDMSLLKFQADTVPDAYRRPFELAMKLSAGEKALAMKIKEDFAAKLEDGIQAGLIERGREDYGVPQRWKIKPETEGDFTGDKKKGSPGKPNAKLDSRDPFFSFQRETPGYFEGIMSRGVPENLDIAHLVATYDAAFHKSLSSRGMIAALQEAKARDGLPVTKISGAAHAVPNGEGGKAYFVDSKAWNKSDVTTDGRPYRSLDHTALKGWKLAFKDESGNPIIVKGDMLIHPDHFDYLKNELGQSRLREGVAGKVLNPVFQSQAFLKASKLSGSLFHLFTIGEHMASHLQSPFLNGFKLDMRQPDQTLLVRNGLELGMSYPQMAYEEGLMSAHSGLFNKIPLLGDLSAKMTDWMFKDYIPAIMMKVGLKTLESNRKRYGAKLTPDQIAELTAMQMNAAGGLLNYRLRGAEGNMWGKLGADKTWMDLQRMALMAPQFLESRARVLGQALKPYGHEQRKMLIIQAGLLYVGARILNQLLDEDPHWHDNPFSVVHNGRAYSIRTIVGDFYHLLTDPKSFAAGRLSPFARIGIESITGRDLRTGARKEPPIQTEFVPSRVAQNAVMDVINWLTPIPVDGLLPGAAGKEQTAAGMLLSSIGVGSRKFTASMQIRDLAADFNRSSEDPATRDFQLKRDGSAWGNSDYRKLDALLDAGDLAGARQEYDGLLKDGKVPANIEGRYERQAPFTGNQKREAKFLESLTPKQLELYDKARAEQTARNQAFKAMLEK